jgi:hypothetical protein
MSGATKTIEMRTAAPAAVFGTRTRAGDEHEPTPCRTK